MRLSLFPRPPVEIPSLRTLERSQIVESFARSSRTRELSVLITLAPLMRSSRPRVARGSVKPHLSQLQVSEELIGVVVELNSAIPGKFVRLFEEKSQLFAW